MKLISSMLDFRLQDEASNQMQGLFGAFNFTILLGGAALTLPFKVFQKPAPHAQCVFH